MRAIPNELRGYQTILRSLARIRRELRGLDPTRAYTPWRNDRNDELDIFQQAILERRELLTNLAAGTRPGRLGGGKLEGKAQNLVRLRLVAINLAVAVSRAHPSLRRDPRWRHGELRASVVDRTAAILATVYGIRFTSAELRDLIHNSKSRILRHKIAE